MVLKVYGPVTAVCPQRVMACLFEMGVEFEVIHVDLEKGEQKKPQHLTRQPFGQVPVVEDGDFRLFESRAIIRYYAAKHGSSRGPNLIGTTLEERALMDQWLEVEAHNYNDLVFNIIYQLIILPQMGIPGDQAVVDGSKKKLDGVLNVYEERLTESKYLAGNAFTLADLSHLPATNYLMGLPGMDHLVRVRKHVNGWWEDISSRPAWKKVLKLSTS